MTCMTTYWEPVMTTAKHQAQPPGAQTKDPDKLRESIDTLDHLISRAPSNAPGHPPKQALPVLEDLVDPDDVGAGDDEEWPGAASGSIADAGLPPEALDDLIAGIEEKLAAELDSLVNILKGSLRDTITAEIRSRLETSQESSPAGGHAKKDP